MSVYETLKDYLAFAMLALGCLWDQIMGREYACPPCWKCTTIRWVAFVATVVGAFAIFGAWAWFAAALVLAWVIYNGDGPWMTVREWVAKLWSFRK